MARTTDLLKILDADLGRKRREMRERHAAKSAAHQKTTDKYEASVQAAMGKALQSAAAKFHGVIAGRVRVYLVSPPKDGKPNRYHECEIHIDPNGSNMRAKELVGTAQRLAEEHNAAILGLEKQAASIRRQIMLHGAAPELIELVEAFAKS